MNTSVIKRLAILVAIAGFGGLLLTLLPVARDRGTHLSAASAQSSTLPRTLQWDQLLPDAGSEHASVPALDGQRIALAGYMTPLDVEAGTVRRFLLVPYVGACIHVPAPPPNQIVLVESAEPVPLRDMWDPFTATGTLHVETNATGLAETGYTLTLDHIGPFDTSEPAVEDTQSGDDVD